MNPEKVSNDTVSNLVTDLQKSRSVLKNINWNFYQQSAFSPGEMRPFKSSAHHWCPATFVPEIPFTLIETLTLPNAVVYDPFGGIGTTYFQALILNRKPITTEICTISVKYMRSLFSLFNPELKISDIKKTIASIISSYKSDVDYANQVENATWFIGKLKPWYSPSTFNELVFLFLAENNCQDIPTKAAIWISISGILQTTCSQDRGWGCIADNVLPKPPKIKYKNALILFVGHVMKLLDDISEHLSRAMPGYLDIYRSLKNNQTIFHRDVREAKDIPNKSVDLVVTSPPYPNMTDYVTSRRLSYYFVGQEMTDDSRLEIGARIRRKRKDALIRYSEDMNLANKVIADKLKTNGYACYVMPIFSSDNENNENRRKIVDDIMTKIEGLGLEKEEEYERILPTLRRSHNAKWATLEKEKVYLYRKV